MRQRTTVVTRELPSTSGRGQVDELLQSEGPMDEAEQALVIEDFEDMQLQQARTWRVCFGALSLLVGAVFLFSAWSQHARPWELRHVGEFRSVVEHGPAVAALLLQATALGTCGLGMLMAIPAKGDRERGCMPSPLRHRLVLGTALLLALGGAAFWGHKMAQMQAKFGRAGAKWDLSWVPAAPVVTVLMCLFVSASLDATAKEVARLRTLRYAHRKV